MRCNGVIAVNLGDIDADGTDDTVTVTPTMNAATMSWAVATAAGTDACVSWIEC